MRQDVLRRRLKDCTLSDYVKSVYVNKYTLTGYIGAAAFVGLSFLHSTPGDISEMFYLGLAKCATGAYAFMTLQQTFFGVTTLMSYERTKKHLKEYGFLPKEFSKLNEHYCDEVGMNLALKESKLEKMTNVNH